MCRSKVEGFRHVRALRGLGFRVFRNHHVCQRDAIRTTRFMRQLCEQLLVEVRRIFLVFHLGYHIHCLRYLDLCIEDMRHKVRYPTDGKGTQGIGI